MIVFVQSGRIRAKVVVFGQKRLYSDKNDCIRAIGSHSGKGGCNRAQWFYSEKSGCIRAKVVVIGQKWLYLGKVVVFDKIGGTRVKVVVLWQN